MKALAALSIALLCMLPAHAENKDAEPKKKKPARMQRVFEDEQEPLRHLSDARKKSGAGRMIGRCLTNDCPSGSICILVEVQCATDPCSPMRECVLP